MSTEPRGLTEQPATISAASHDRRTTDGRATDHNDVRALVAWYVIAVVCLIGFVINWCLTLFLLTPLFLGRAMTGY